MKFLSFIKYGIVLTSLFILDSAAQHETEAYPDISIIQSDNSGLTIEFRPQNFKIYDSEIAGKDWSSLTFDYADVNTRPGQPELPRRIFTIGVPKGAKPRVSIIQQQGREFPNTVIVPVPYFIRNKQGISEYRYEFDQQDDNRRGSLPRSRAQIIPGGKFRDINIIRIAVTPFHYNISSRSLTFYEKITLRIDYGKQAPRGKRFRKQGKLDELYKDILLNFEQASSWQSAKIDFLRKPAQLPAGTWYRFSVDQDGLFKITPAVLQNAGINISGLNVNDIRLFNNGGHALNVNVDGQWYNPDHISEIPVLMKDLNQNGIFDGNDFLVFYGKHVNGWFFDPVSGDFKYQMHPYAKKNIYWLNVNGTNGLRMQRNITAGIPGATEATYFYERYHFEEDLYNLLSSGPDWYGRRFYGLSDAWSKSFQITTNNQPGSSPKFRIQLKGGSGIKYGDNLPYKYHFKVLLNNQTLYSNIKLNEERLTTETKYISDPNTIINGTNSLTIQYSADKYESSNAYLDWFELYFPHSFSADQNTLNFYTSQPDQQKRYMVSGFSSVDDIYVFNVTDPAAPFIIKEDMVPTSGEIAFDLDIQQYNQNLLIASLSSAKIKTISGLTPYSPGYNLLDTNNQADFLIITHKTFTPWAERLANLRTEFSSRIVSTEDIYFYFNGGVPDPVAMRNFIRYAYNNWQGASPSYVLLFGDGHFDYRNITLSDTMRVPPYEIYDDHEIDSRTTDMFYVDMDYAGGEAFSSISPDLAIGRLPIESTMDADRVLDKLIRYQTEALQDGWQINVTMVADDQYTTRSNSEWMHQNQTEKMARLSQLRKFNFNKVYLSTYPSVPGGFGRVKPAANEDIINFLNQGTLIINYVGHGSPTQWAHENVLNMHRDLNRINNAGKLPFMIAATCDFGKFDDPHDPSFAEALIWKKESGVIGVLAASRLVYSTYNAAFNIDFYEKLFPSGSPSATLGKAWLGASYGTSANINDQKYHLFADPTMRLADPRGNIFISLIEPDTLKALSQVDIEADVLNGDQPDPDFNGGAVLIVNDARYDSVKTGSGFHLVTLPGQRIFKGEVSVEAGKIKGRFIVPKSIRYEDKKSGRISIFSWNDDQTLSAAGYDNSLLFIGSSNINDSDGPEIDIYFKNQENFSPGDFIGENPVLIASIEDENGINMTGETGHNISIFINDEKPRNLSGFFVYEKDSFTKGSINYPLDDLPVGRHRLRISAYDNLNNPAEYEVDFKIALTSELALSDVVNYPNPFRQATRFTFQTNREGADVKIKIYTISGRLIQELQGMAQSGYNEDIEWDGRDRDGDEIANGVYIYKLILSEGGVTKETIEKLVILK